MELVRSKHTSYQLMRFREFIPIFRAKPIYMGIPLCKGSVQSGCLNQWQDADCTDLHPHPGLHFGISMNVHAGCLSLISTGCRHRTLVHPRWLKVAFCTAVQVHTLVRMRPIYAHMCVNSKVLHIFFSLSARKILNVNICKLLRLCARALKAGWKWQHYTFLFCLFCTGFIY